MHVLQVQYTRLTKKRRHILYDVICLCMVRSVFFDLDVHISGTRFDLSLAASHGLRNLLIAGRSLDKEDLF